MGEWRADLLASVGVPSRTVLSSEPDAMLWPSGPEGHAVHGFRVAPQWATDGPAESASQIRTVSSKLPEAMMRRPSGAESHTGHLVLVTGDGLADRLAGVGIPYPDGFVIAGGDAVAVGT